MDETSLVLQYIKNLLPESYFNDITTFCMIPDIPFDANKPEIVIATKNGEFIECKDRRVIKSLLIEPNVEIKEIILHFTKSISKIAYLLRSEQKVHIVQEHENDLIVVSVISNVTKVELDDEISSGDVQIRIWLFDDAIPVVLNGEYKVNEGGENFGGDMEDEASDERFVSLVKSKLSEARLNTAYSIQLLEEKRKFRQEIMFLSEEEARYRDEETQDAEKIDKLFVGEVWQRIYCEKWVIGLPLENVSDGPITDIELLMKWEESNIFSYSTHLYQSADCPPYWASKTRTAVAPGSSFTMMAIAEEPQFVNSPRVALKASLRYKYKDVVLSLPLPRIEANAASLVNNEMHPVLRQDDHFGQTDALAILSTGIKTELDIHFASNDLEAFFTEKLKFHLCALDGNAVLRHCSSPLNALHGTTLYVSKDKENSNIDKVIVLSRTENQVLLLINLIYDLFPSRCVIVPSGYNVREKTNNKMTYDPTASEKMETSQDFLTSEDKGSRHLLDYASVINQQMSAVSQHLEKCLEAMSESNAKKLSSKADASMNIDVTALGENRYNDLWNLLIENMIVRNDLLNKILKD